jgi:hypothetical protein
MYAGTIILIYLMWSQRDVWIPRLLTSNSRVRHSAILHEQKANGQAEQTQSSSGKDSASTKDSSSTLSDQDDIVDDDDDSFDNNQTSISSNSDDDSPTTTTTSSATSKPSATHKLNVRTRRNKMSFSKDPQVKKPRLLHRRAADGDDVEDTDLADDDDIEDARGDGADTDDTDDDIDENTVKSIKDKEGILPSSIHSSKNHHHHNRHHRSVPANEENHKAATHTKNGLVISQRVDIVEQLRHLIKSQGRNRDLLATLIKETDLDKTKLNRFINKKDFSVVSLDILINFLDLYD